MKTNLPTRILIFSAIILVPMLVFGILFNLSAAYQVQKNEAEATIAAVPTATYEALEYAYQKGVGYLNIGQWQDAKITLGAVFEIDPNYKDVQEKLIEINASIQMMTPTPLPTIAAIATAVILPATARPTLSPSAPSTTSSTDGIMQLNFNGRSPVAGINIPTSMSTAPTVGDLAWNKPTFASSYWQDNYPTGATSGGKWLCAGSTNSWFYVDLGQPEDIHQIVTTLFVDADYTSAPRTAFIISNDLKNWEVVYNEVNYENASNRGQPRVITLPEDVKARYVGIYATGWGGGWASQTIFTVLPPEYPFQE